MCGCVVVWLCGCEGVGAHTQSVCVLGGCGGWCVYLGVLVCVCVRCVGV